MLNDVPSTSGVIDFPGTLPSGRLEMTSERKKSRNCWVSGSAGGLTALGGSSCRTKVPGESANPCKESSFATKNVISKYSRIDPRGITWTAAGRCRWAFRAH